MGCLNSDQSFEHWFGNIHFSGPCNRSCYFCIGQHMMSLDPLNNLDIRPENMLGLPTFIERCQERPVSDVNLTGSNTDPLLYNYLGELIDYLRYHLPDVEIGIRTNGVLVLDNQHLWQEFDKASISVTSLDPDLYEQTMGQGRPPSMAAVKKVSQGEVDLKVNTVLCPETVESGDITRTIELLSEMGYRTVNLREPYGQPRVGDPLAEEHEPVGKLFGMPQYEMGNVTVTYWDVHYVEVESVNLYANGRVSEAYPITSGHDPENGKVLPQAEFKQSGRVREQWVNY